MLQRYLLTKWNAFITLVFPNICINCRTVLVDQEEVLCLKCKFDLPKTKNHLSQDTPQLRKFAFSRKVTFVYSYLWYQKGNSTQKMVAHLKYKNMPQVGVVLGRWYGNILKESRLEADYLIPVPLNKKKQQLRGYNQSEMVAQGLSERLGIPVRTDAVSRVVNTQTQTKKSRIDRWSNMELVFQVDQPSLLAGKKVIIVDDVLTTGATMGSLIELLEGAGVESIGILTIGVGK